MFIKVKVNLTSSPHLSLIDLQGFFDVDLGLNFIIVIHCDISLWKQFQGYYTWDRFLKFQMTDHLKDQVLSIVYVK